MRNIFKQKHITPGVRAITRSTAILWSGWGFAETLIPVLLFSFSSSYAEAGLFRSIFDIVYILAVPLIGLLADKKKATTLLMWGFALYIIVGASYFAAGITGMAIFIILARGTNGISYALSLLSKDSYFNRHVTKKHVGAAFGYFDTVANFWWLISAIAGMILVNYFSVTSLLLLIVPAACIAMLNLWHFKSTHAQEKIGNSKDKLSQIFTEIKQWSAQLRLFVLLSFFLSFVSSAVMFFIPIQAYQDGASLSLVILLGIISTLPSLFGLYFGGLLDKSGHKLFSRGLLLFAVLLCALALLPTYTWQIAIVFLISVSLELLSIGTSKLILVSANPGHFGRVDGLTESIADIGSMAGPLIAGLSLDLVGPTETYLGLACVLLALLVITRLPIKKALAIS